MPRVPLCRLPTPVRPLSALCVAAGVPDGALWVKDDALSAPLWGGNKPRKLEWILGDVERRRRRTILTFGALGTNHGLATARYAREHGVHCVLALVDQPVDEHVERQLARIRASGARVHRTRGPARTALATPYLLARYAQLRPPRPPYFLGPGGSSPVGALGFVEAGLELAGQIEAGELPEPEAVVVALGSGGSAAGLLAGLRLAGLRTRVVAVLVNDQLRLSEAVVLRLSRRTLALLGRRGADVAAIRPARGDVEVVREFLGRGYGHATPEAQDARRLAAESEALELEPVYTAKTVAAILDRLRRGAGRGRPLLYWHTHSGIEDPR